MVMVKMRSIYAGPSGCCDADRSHNVPEKEAAELVKGGYASYHEAPKAHKAPKPEEKAVPEAETADLKLPENASNAPQARKRQGGA